MMGSQGDMQDKMPGPPDGVLPPIQVGMKKVESAAEIMNLTLHQVRIFGVHYFIYKQWKR